MKVRAMVITVLDGYTLNPGDLSWEPLRRLGACRIFDRTPPGEIAARSAGAEIVLTNKAPLSRTTMEQLPGLRYIGVLATGYNIVDVGAARERGIVVTNVPGYATASVAQLVFAHILNLACGLTQHTDAVRAGRWSSSQDFSFRETPLVELAGLTMGIVGFGQTGRATAELALAFGMRVIVSGRPGASLPPDRRVRPVLLDDLFRLSDVVSLHCPLTPETKSLVDERRLSLMKPSAFLINTGRGPLIDESALARALDERRIAGAGLDVLSVEPPPADHVLLRARNCFVTPHIAWASTEARKRLLGAVVTNIEAFLAGAPQNVVS